MPNAPYNPFSAPIPSCFDHSGVPTTFVNCAPNIGTWPYTGRLIDGTGTGINYAGGNTVGAGGYIPIFEEYSDSPTIESGEQSTIVHRFHGDWYTCQLYLLWLKRGTVLTDVQGYSSRVLTTTLQPIAKTGGRECNLTVTAEAMEFGTPPDEFDVTPVELNPAAEKHPRYAALTYKQRYWVNQCQVSDNIDVANTYYNLLSGSTSPTFTSLQQAEALELLFKKQKQEDSFYLSGYKVTWSSYFWFPQTINPGGYIEDPVLNGNLPYQFWSSDGSGNANSNIFQATSVMNVNMFPNWNEANLLPPYGLSWLRQTDQLVLNRTWFKLTRSWLGAPLGHWDYQWYNATFQPYETSQDIGSYNT